MHHATVRSLIPAAALLAAMFSATPIAYAEDPPAPAVPAPTTPDAAAPTTPSPETLKKARDNGLKPEVRKGVTVYCWEDANIGSHFKTKKCVDETQLAQVIEQRQAAKDMLTRGGGNYGSAK